MREQIEHIPDGNFVGYYWLSNAQKPKIVNGDFPQNILEQQLPFIVEGSLYDAAIKCSIAIRHNGEKHVIYKYDLSSLTGIEINDVAFIAHRMLGKGKVKFRELWREEEDPLCAGMTTLRPHARVFVGFDENQ